MDSLRAALTIALKGNAKGTTVNSSAFTPLRFTTAPTVSLTSTGTGAAQANSAGFIGKNRTLAGGANEELDFFSFTSVLNETLATMTEMRIFYMIHNADSSASSITAGNGSGNNFNPLSIGTSTTITMTPGQGFVFFSPTTAGMPVSNTIKTWKVLNNDGSNSATYQIGIIGSTS